MVSIAPGAHWQETLAPMNRVEAPECLSYNGWRRGEGTLLLQAMTEVRSMETLQEFLILESDGDVAVYRPSTFPRGTQIGPDAQRLRVVGPSRVEPPRIQLTRLEFDRWRQELESAGRQVTLGPFWTGPYAFLPLEEIIRRGATFRSLEEVRDELLRSG